MQFAAVFVEYLVTGCGALVWIGIFLGLTADTLTKLGPGHIPLLIPLVYLIGMFADASASVLLQPVKAKAKSAQFPWKAGSRARDPELAGAQRNAFVVLHSPDLGRELQLMSSRDRIARGAFLNIVLTVSMAVILPERAEKMLPMLSGRLPTMLVGSFLAAVAFILWWTAEYSTSQFKDSAIKLIRDQQKAQAANPVQDKVQVPAITR